MAQYTRIIVADSPRKIVVGNSEAIKVDVENKYTTVMSVKVIGFTYMDVPGMGTVPFAFTFTPSYANPDPGAASRFTASFTMLVCTRMTTYLSSYWYGADGQWHIDDTISETITNEAEVREILYWNPSTGHYDLSSPPTISAGSEAGAQFNLYNLSSGYLNLGLYITAFDPLGNSLGARLAGPAYLAPGGSFGGHYRVVTSRPGA
ncbi:MAG: hypothetical protein PHQ43_12220, partial [Dehalococcoidales bacterium]|nr:hypothetical protein [Dehalococcoidales bacterium]